MDILKYLKILIGVLAVEVIIAIIPLPSNMATLVGGVVYLALFWLLLKLRKANQGFRWSLRFMVSGIAILIGGAFFMPYIIFNLSPKESMAFVIIYMVLVMGAIQVLAPASYLWGINQLTTPYSCKQYEKRLQMVSVAYVTIKTTQLIYVMAFSLYITNQIEVDKMAMELMNLSTNNPLVMIGDMIFWVASLIITIAVIYYLWETIQILQRYTVDDGLNQAIKQD